MTNELNYNMPLMKLLNFMLRPTQQRALEDRTLYQVATRTNNYSGRISYQDNVVIWLSIEEEKQVKILKDNIVRITILQSA